MRDSTMNETINEEGLSDKITKEIEKYETLKKAFKNINDSENTLYAKRLEAFEGITDINETEQDNTKLRDIYSIFTKDMKVLENYRNTQTTNMNEKIIPAISYYIASAKNYKKNIGNYKDIKKKNEKEEKEMRNAQSSIEKDNLKRSININKSTLQEQGKGLESDMILFENERIISNKYLILHFIHAELAYHAQALEKLSIIYEQINDLEPIEELKQFTEKYKLNEIDSNDLKAYGYDERKIRDTKRNRENLKSTVIGQSIVGTSVNNNMGIGASQFQRSMNYVEEGDYNYNQGVNNNPQFDNLNDV